MLLTFDDAYFFSVPTTAPLRCAAFNALFPLIVVSRSAAPGPRTLLPILVTLFQSSLILVVVGAVGVVMSCHALLKAVV